MPRFCSSVDKQGDKNRKVEIDELPADHERLIALLEGSHTPLKEYQECLAYTEKRETTVKFETAMATAAGSGVGGALVGAGAALIFGGPIVLGIGLGVIVGFGFSLMGFAVKQIVDGILER